MLMRAIIAFLALWTYLAPSRRAQELPSSIERYVNAQSLEIHFSGAVLVAHGNEVLINKSFVTPSALGEKSSQVQNRFPAGSLTEQFIAAAILQLELAGRVRLDSPICDYISGCPAEWKQIQLQHLLTHSSGLPSPPNVSPCVERAVLKPSAVMAMLSGKPLLFEPGNSFNFNGLDYFFLSAVIERISGQLTSEYLDQHIFHPLNLAQTGYLVSVSQPKVSADTTQAGCTQAELPANPVSFSGELYTSSDDLYRWNRALSTDKFLPKNSLNEMYTPYVEGHGFGWKILKEFDRKVAVQNSESDSNSISIRIYPDDDTCIIVVSWVHEVAASGLSHQVAALLFGEHYPVTSNPGAVRH
jgi:CubicO group peptidase (beta-lactamase class C family)